MKVKCFCNETLPEEYKKIENANPTLTLPDPKIDLC